MVEQDMMKQQSKLKLNDSRMEIIPEKDSKFKQNNFNDEDDILNQSGY